MMKEKSIIKMLFGKKDWTNLDSILVFVFSLAFFSYIGFYCTSDIYDHAIMACDRIKDNRVFQGNFLLYILVNIFTGFTENPSNACWCLAFLLSFSVLFKYLITKNILIEYTGSKISILIPLTLLIVFSIPFSFILRRIGIIDYGSILWGNYSPTVWHNSTIIFSMPFCIMMYTMANKQLTIFSSKRNMFLSIVTIICTLIKPSFFFVFVVAFPILMLYKYKLSRQFLLSLLPVLVGAICVWYEYGGIYVDNSDGSSAIVDFSYLVNLEVWFSKITPLIGALFLPIIYSVLCFRSCYKDLEFYFLILMLIAAFGIEFVCHEIGPREAHGNFSWQIIPVLFLSYLYVIKSLCSRQKSETILRSSRAVNSIIGGIYYFRVAWGIIYILGVIITTRTWSL